MIRGKGDGNTVDEKSVSNVGKRPEPLVGPLADKKLRKELLS